MATYYTFDTAVEEFVLWYEKCQHYGIEPKNVIDIAMKEYGWVFEDQKESEKTEGK